RGSAYPPPVPARETAGARPRWTGDKPQERLGALGEVTEAREGLEDQLRETGRGDAHQTRLRLQSGDLARPSEAGHAGNQFARPAFADWSCATWPVPAAPGGAPPPRSTRWSPTRPRHVPRSRIDNPLA